MPKRPKMCRFSSSSFSSLRFLFPHDFSGTITDRDMTNTPPKPFRPTDVLFGDYKTETKDLGGILAEKLIFFC